MAHGGTISRLIGHNRSYANDRLRGTGRPADQFHVANRAISGWIKVREGSRTMCARLADKIACERPDSYLYGRNRARPRVSIIDTRLCRCAHTASDPARHCIVTPGSDTGGVHTDMAFRARAPKMSHDRARVSRNRRGRVRVVLTRHPT